MSFKGKFTTIHEGFSQHRRMPRLGKIRLGLKVKNSKGVEYPKEVDYFVVPQEVARVYGDQPQELDVMLPLEDPGAVFPQKLAKFGSSKGLTCHGDGVQAERWNPEEKKWEARACPCEDRKTDENPKGSCSEMAHLMVILPKINMGGVYQVTTRSYNSVVDINSGLDYLKALVGRVALVPLKLKRQKRETHKDGKKGTHYTMTLTLDATPKEVCELRDKGIRPGVMFEIEPPVEESPASDPIDLLEGPEEPEGGEFDAGESAFLDWVEFMLGTDDGLQKLNWATDQLWPGEKKGWVNLTPEERQQLQELVERGDS